MRKKSPDVKENSPPDYLTPLLIYGPAGWALIRANEIRALDGISFKQPVLDVGCGDGFVAKVILKSRRGKFDWGIDLSETEIEKAKKIGSYKNCKVASVYELPFKDGSFNTVFSNSAIEHLKDLDKALSEISRVIKIRGKLIITVPSPYLSHYLFGSYFFSAVGVNSVAKVYARFFNSLFKHYNLYNHKQWAKILKKHCFVVVKHHYYHTQEMIRVHEFLSYLAIPYELFKKVFGFWPVFSSLRKILLAPILHKLLWQFYIADTNKDEGGSLLLIAQKMSQI